jgi:hypothetical protein
MYAADNMGRPIEGQRMVAGAKRQVGCGHALPAFEVCPCTHNVPAIDLDPFVVFVFLAPVFADFRAFVWFIVLTLHNATGEDRPPDFRFVHRTPVELRSNVR